MSCQSPLVLCILDGWGYREGGADNSIAQAHTPHWDDLWANSPHSLLEASGPAVGLPEGQMGNSEVGHMTIGAGRVIDQDLPRIDKAIAEDRLQRIPELNTFIEQLKSSGGTCHLLGLFSSGGVHSHQNHILALATILQNHAIPVVFHPFLDGRDTPPQSATCYLQGLTDFCESHPSAQVGTVSGRYYAMDRDNRWDRIQLAYIAMVDPGSDTPQAPSPLEALENSYEEGVTDEFLLPTVIGDYKGMADGDGLLMANFRADRVRQILEALLNPAFEGSPRPKVISFAATLGMVEYSQDHNAWMDTLFPSQQPSQTLGEVISKNGLRQLRAAETEKYAHVTFFFNGGREPPFSHEDRILIPSPAVATYDLKPEMSAPELTSQLTRAIESQSYDLIVVNYANTDMVGHTGDQEATQQAVQAVDTALGKIMDSIRTTGGILLVTADHGNAETMANPDTQAPYTAHTLNPVPFVIYGATPEDSSLRNGRLADIAPTVLQLMHIEKPQEMTGKSLLK